MKFPLVFICVAAMAIVVPGRAETLAAIPATNSSSAPFPGVKTEWMGFERYDFKVNDKPAIVVVPSRPLPGKPWAWKGEFFGAFPAVDATLVTNPCLFGRAEFIRQSASGELLERILSGAHRKIW